MQDKDEKINQWLEGNLPEEELLKLVPEEEVIAYKQILNEVDQWIPDNDFKPLDIEEIIGSKKTITKKISWKNNHRNLFAIAASVLILLTAALWIYNSQKFTTFETPIGQNKEILLPDGQSKMILASGSTVSWNKDDWSGSKRVLSLQGKGFFSVERGGKFIVNSKKGNVEVLGTQFEVSDITNEFRVSCYEGKVMAITNNDQQLILNAGEEGRFIKDKWNEKSSTTNKTAPWLSTQSTFSNVPLLEVLNTLEKVYDLNILSEGIEVNRKFSGVIPNDNQEVAFSLVFDVFDINYKLDNQKLYLSK